MWSMSVYPTRLILIAFAVLWSMVVTFFVKNPWFGIKTERRKHKHKRRCWLSWRDNLIAIWGFVPNMLLRCPTIYSFTNLSAVHSSL